MKTSVPNLAESNPCNTCVWWRVSPPGAGDVLRALLQHRQLSLRWQTESSGSSWLISCLVRNGWGSEFVRCNAGCLPVFARSQTPQRKAEGILLKLNVLIFLFFLLLLWLFNFLYISEVNLILVKGARISAPRPLSTYWESSTDCHRTVGSSWVWVALARGWICSHTTNKNYWHHSLHSYP